ncbi:glycosyltransferase [Vibrio nitrifigilis]|uniref:Glycosyltransferase family 2 protein n=1 Tax=Vibrio nitrifigilis TaxID=2789781 RepID=A0ABS0GFH3_9VIBR|nr:glycosyltransferase family 2 protein [Vibrio nitrifigilis]MBF9001169.1 glycosyltransferase family 2 protein [Vibrio nitrifigilis]
MAVFISVVNHNHDEMIVSDNTLKELSKQYSVVLKSNTQPTLELTAYCNDAGIHLLTSNQPKGFGANNNEIFEFTKKKLDMKTEDYFLALNPDVIIDNQSLNQLVKLADTHQSDISAINLYRNKEKTEFDNSIRRQHSLLNPLRGLLGVLRKDIYDKSTIKEPVRIDWAAGSFLLFRAETYEELGGFDERYFMYFEDADICKRAIQKGKNVMYFPQIEAIHLAQHDNRKIFSKNFFWYTISLIKFYCNP